MEHLPDSESSGFLLSVSKHARHSKVQEEILLTAVKAICMGFSSMMDRFSSMMDIRYGALNNMHSRTSLRAPQGQRDHNP
jgi:hypothetical protein